VSDDIGKMSLIIDVSCANWMISWIDYMSGELHLNFYSGASLYS
jgi:hypothetical protein